MTNRLAIILVVLILAGLALDLWLGLGGARFLARSFVNMVEWLMFWR